MSYFSGDTERDAEVERCASLVKAAAKMLDKHPNPQTRFGLLWELAFVQLRNLEDYRKPK